MTDRVHEVLDGAAGAEALSAEQRAELASLEAAVQAALGALPQDGSADVSGSVLWRVRELEPVPAWLPEFLVAPWLATQRVGRWLWSPRPIQVRPAWLVATAALLVAVPVSRMEPDTSPIVQAGEASPERMLVQFRVGLPSAQNVSIVGDFTGWEQRRQLEEVAPGVWSVVLALEPGVYDYAFVVDGERWTLDPLAPSVADGFGGTNSRVAVLPPERSGSI